MTFQEFKQERKERWFQGMKATAVPNSERRKEARDNGGASIDPRIFPPQAASRQLHWMRNATIIVLLRCYAPRPST